MLTREHLTALCPRAKEEYLLALTDPEWGHGMMARYQITANHRRLAGFLAQGLHESSGLAGLGEALTYKSPARLKAVWPRRFGPMSDDQCQAYCNNERALASFVYGSRMGNRQGTDDGYLFRGKGFLQITGRNNYLHLGKALGIDFDANPHYADDQRVLFAMSCHHWWEEGCNELMDADDIEAASAKINTGNAKNVAGTVGMADRIRWYRKLMAWLTQNPAVMDGEPAALVESEHPDGDTPPGQTLHWAELQEVA